MDVNDEILPTIEIHPSGDNLVEYLDIDFDFIKIPPYSIKSLKRKNVLNSAGIKADINIQEAENNHSDLVPGFYEGGLKIWECTFDLANYLVSELNNIDFEGKTVLDLGCGAGILGILALKLGSEVVHFQDYNSGVIKNLTAPNVAANGSFFNRVKFWSGDWGGFIISERFDIIMTCETLYNPDNYRRLHDLFVRLLKPHGSIFLAAKTYYFGIGGSIGHFLDVVEGENILDSKHLWSSQEGIKREIIQLSRKGVAQIENF